jgi:hypothetical protein
MHHIVCTNPDCVEAARAARWFDVLDKHTRDGWIVCACGAHACAPIENKQWPAYAWAFLPIEAPPNAPGYHRLLELISSAVQDPPDQARIIYYDVRADGTLKWGHGPGGPPVLTIPEFIEEAHRLSDLVRAGRVLSSAENDHVRRT